MGDPVGWIELPVLMRRQISRRTPAIVNIEVEFKELNE